VTARAVAEQLCAKDGAMPPLVRPGLLELINQTRHGEARHEHLPAINADGSMLAGMIYLEDAITQVIAG